MKKEIINYILIILNFLIFILLINNINNISKKQNMIDLNINNINHTLNAMIQTTSNIDVEIKYLKDILEKQIILKNTEIGDSLKLNISSYNKNKVENILVNDTLYKLTAYKGVNYYNGNKETYYNLDMSGVISNAKNMGIEGEYWVREDGVKMYGDYVIVAANLDVYPRGSTVETSLGMGIVLDTGEFAIYNQNQIDIATNW